jgi:D-xylose transport system substrate-binding protein
MTIYKPIKKLAEGVGQLVAAISKGEDTSVIANQAIKNANGKDIKSVLEPVTEVDISNIKDTVIADGFVKKDDVCKDVPAGAGGVC